MASVTLYPVLREIPLTGKKTPIEIQSKEVRLALQSSLKLSKLQYPFPIEFDEGGAPFSQNNVMISLSHKPQWVGAICAPKNLSPHGMGIDVEQILPRKNARTFDYVADASEWSLCGEQTLENFFRLWTGKEAVLKALGTGLRELAQCKVVEFSPRRKKNELSEMMFSCRKINWHVLQYYFDDFIVSITPLGCEVKWTLERDSGPSKKP